MTLDVVNFASSICIFIVLLGMHEPHDAGIFQYLQVISGTTF